MALPICLSNLRNLSPSLIPELASGNLRDPPIHPAFVLGRTLVSCSLAWQQGRQSHCAASQNIDDKLSEKTCPLVASVRSPSKHIEHPTKNRVLHKESQGIPAVQARFRAALLAWKNQILNKKRQTIKSTRSRCSFRLKSCVSQWE